MVPLDTAPVRAFLDDKHVTLAERVSEFATRELAPLPEPKDDAGARQQARELLGKLGAAGGRDPFPIPHCRHGAFFPHPRPTPSPPPHARFALPPLHLAPPISPPPPPT